ncbi:MAG: acetyl-CoA carboxylase biotin carboxyl carrier protein subunit [Bacteriovoracia bacterium]
MSRFFKTSANKEALNSAGASEGAWKFERRPGPWIIATRTGVGGAVVRVRLLATEVNGKFWAQVGGVAHAGEIVEASAGGRDAGGSDADLVAQFPGKVRKLLVKAGDAVEKGTPLLLVEAMKMEFAIKAPSAGKVTKVLVAEGQQLSPGDRFLEIQ